jgi:hypothetical protein
MTTHTIMCQKCAMDRVQLYTFNPRL